MTIPLPRRFAELRDEPAFQVLAAARAREAQGHRVIHFEIGQPDAHAPAHVVEAGIRALRDGKAGYAPAAGIPELRDAIARYSGGRGVAARPDQVVVTPGPKAALFAAMAGVLAPGDEVLSPAIGFPAYTEISRFLDARPVYYDLDANGQFAVRVEELERRVTPRTRVLMLNAPHNPTGGVIAREALPAIAEFATRHDLTVITDEIYGDLQFDDAFASFAAVPGMQERTIVVDGLSKNFAMTGWRLGYLVAPPGLGSAFERFATHNFSCTSTFVQYGAVAAMQGPADEVIAARERYAARAVRVARALDALPGVRCHVPQGAFYAFPDLRELLRASGLSSESVAHLALEKFGVAVLPGTAFGRAGQGFLRLAYLQPDDVLDQGMARLSECLTSVGARAASA